MRDSQTHERDEQHARRRSSEPSTSTLSQPAALPRTMPKTTPSTPRPASSSPTTSARTRSPKLFGRASEHERDGDDAERDVEPEDRLPVPALDDGAADQRAERDAEAGDAAPDADGGGPQALADAAGEQGERERHERRGADALHGAGGDEHPRLGREGARSARRA